MPAELPKSRRDRIQNEAPEEPAEPQRIIDETWRKCYGRDDLTHAIKGSFRRRRLPGLHELENGNESEGDEED